MWGVPNGTRICIHDKTDAGDLNRLPNSIRLPDRLTSVDIVRRGRAWIIVPSNESWAEWFECETVSDDFIGERDQAEAQERDTL